MHLQAEVMEELNEQARQTLLRLGLIDDTRAVRLSVSVVPSFKGIEKRERDDVLEMPMEEFGKLIESPGKANTIKQSGRFYLGQLVRSNEGEIRAMQAFGVGIVDTIKTALEALGASLEMTTPYTAKEIELIRAIRLDDAGLSFRYCHALYKPWLVSTVGELADLSADDQEMRETYPDAKSRDAARELLKVCGFAA